MTPSAALPVGSIPLVGLGTWRLRGAEATSVVATALELGYRHIDTATMYGNEADIGRALAGAGSSVFLTTKLPAERASDARRTLEASLAALGVSAV
ncbi:MAG: aldo/keto reductase, partial [Actinomycetota bacterium]|nr:aldo/keto reductase [Actinomycetota bacterium]